jgi:hypothetical protein
MDACKRLRVHAPPQVLVLHLKHFGFDAKTGRGTKLEEHVAFDERLELAPGRGKSTSPSMSAWSSPLDAERTACAA